MWLALDHRSLVRFTATLYGQSLSLFRTPHAFEVWKQSPPARTGYLQWHISYKKSESLNVRPDSMQPWLSTPSKFGNNPLRPEPPIYSDTSPLRNTRLRTPRWHRKHVPPFSVPHLNAVEPRWWDHFRTRTPSRITGSFEPIFNRTIDNFTYSVWHFKAKQSISQLKISKQNEFRHSGKHKKWKPVGLVLAVG